MVEEVRLLYAPFKNFISGHVCLVFKLQDGQEVVISPEARADRFIPLLGFLPFYQLKYTHLKYADYITKYESVSGSFHSTSLNIPTDTARLIYEEMLSRVNDLEFKQETYHILLNSCITNTFSHLKTALQFDISIFQSVLLLFKPELIAKRIPVQK